MLELVEDEAQAVRVVKLALDVDLRLGARLAGAVKLEWQEQTVGLVAGLEIPQLLKLQLLGLTKSEKAIPHLNQALEHEYSFVRGKAIYALGKIGNVAATEALIKALEHTDSDVLGKAIYALGKIGDVAATEALIKALEHEDYFVGWSAVDALGEICNAAATEALIKALEHTDSDVREKAVEALGKIGNAEATEALIKALTNTDSGIREKAVEALGKIGNAKATEALNKALEHEDYFVREKAAEILSKTLEQEDSDVHEGTAESLGEIGKAASIEDLSKALKHEDYCVSWSAVEALGKIGNAEATEALTKALEHEDFFVRLIAAGTLGKIGNGEIIEALNKALKHEDFVTANQGRTLEESIEALEAIQGRYKFYNYTLTQSPQMEDKPKSEVKRDQVFISYSHKDKKWLGELQNMLDPMRRNDSILVWDDTKIRAGAKWRDEIEKALARANVAVLMVSANFLASNFIAKHELPPLLKAAEQEGLKIIWVLVSSCLYDETEIHEYQAAHNVSQPLDRLTVARRNQVLTEICRKIKAASSATT
jgi:HEAT repeat protein